MRRCRSIAGPTAAWAREKEAEILSKVGRMAVRKVFSLLESDRNMISTLCLSLSTRFCACCRVLSRTGCAARWMEPLRMYHVSQRKLSISCSHTPLSSLGGVLVAVVDDDETVVVEEGFLNA